MHRARVTDGDDLAVATPGLWGRDRELTTVAEVVGDTPPGLSGLLIAGEPGIGKSSLWVRGLQVGRRAGSRVLATTCVQAEAEMPYAGLEELLSDLLDEHAGALPGPQRDALDGALLRRHPETTTDPRTVARGVLTLLARASDGDRLMIAVDDLQWMDAETRTCLVYALRRLRARPLTVLLTAREPSPLSTSPDGPFDASLADAAGPTVTTLRPSPLSGAAVRDMVRERLGVTMSVDDGRALAEETGGNPFWALSLESPGRVVGDGGAPVLAALVAGRVAGLDDEAREAACLVAALGRPLPRAVVAAMGDGAESALDRAVGAGLVDLAGGRLTCSHPLIATALLAGLPPFTRRRLHRRAADLTASVEARAQHLAHATDDAEPGERAELLAALDAALHSARQRGAISTALRFAARGLALIEDHPPGGQDSTSGRRVAIAELHHRASAPDQALAMLEHVDLDTLEPQVLEWTAPLLAGLTHRRRGGAAARAVVEAVAALPGKGLAPAQRARRQALVSTLRADLHCGAVGDRRAVAADAVERTRTAGVGPPLRRRALGSLVRARLDAGEHPGDALDAIGVAADGTEPGISAHPELITGITAWSAVDMDAARAAFAAVYERHLVVGDEPGVVLAADMLACAELLVDSAAAAERTLTRLAEHVDQVSLQHGYFVRARGLLHLVRGEHDALEAMLDRYDSVTGWARGSAPRTGSPTRPAMKQRAMMARQRGELDTAVALLDRFCALADELGVRNPLLRLDADVVLAETLIALGDHDRAARIADGLSSAVGARASAFVHGQRCRIRARLAARHDLDAALALARESVGLHDRGPFVAERAQSRLALAEVHDLRGEMSAARDQRRIARQFFSGLGYTWWAGQVGDDAEPSPALGTLSPSERSVVELVATGVSNREAATHLHLSIRTVENHLARAYRKLGVRSRAELRAHAPGDTPSPTRTRLH